MEGKGENYFPHSVLALKKEERLVRIFSSAIQTRQDPYPEFKKKGRLLTGKGGKEYFSVKEHKGEPPCNKTSLVE